SALAPNDPAIAAAAPPRFSTTIGCPGSADSGPKPTRGMTSVALPAAKATIARIGLLGQVCATASLLQPSSTAETTINHRGMQHSSSACPRQGSEAKAVPPEEEPGSAVKITRPRPRSAVGRALAPRAAAAGAGI